MNIKVFCWISTLHLVVLIHQRGMPVDVVEGADKLEHWEGPEDNLAILDWTSWDLILPLHIWNFSCNTSRKDVACFVLPHSCIIHVSRCTYISSQPATVATSWFCQLSEQLFCKLCKKLSFESCAKSCQTCTSCGETNWSCILFWMFFNLDRPRAPGKGIRTSLMPSILLARAPKNGRRWGRKVIEF